MSETPIFASVEQDLHVSYDDLATTGLDESAATGPAGPVPPAEKAAN